MNKYYFAAIAVLIITFLCGCTSPQAKDPSLSILKKKGELVLGFDDKFPPMGFTGQNGEYSGFDIDLAKETAKRMGIKLVLKPVVWENVITDLTNKTIDVIWSGLTITDERKAVIAFSKPYIESRQIIIVKSDSGINTILDLKSKTVGLQQGSTSEAALNGSPETLQSIKKVEKFKNNTQALDELKNGKIDAVFIDEISGRYYLSQLHGEFIILAENLGFELSGVGFRKEDQSLREELDKVLDKIMNDGTGDKISKKWFGEAKMLAIYLQRKSDIGR